MTNKKIDVPQIGGLLSRISEKRPELPKSPLQAVQPVEAPAPAEEPTTPAAKPEKRKAGKTAAVSAAEPSSTGGRPSVKIKEIEYVKLSPRIPKPLKKRAEQAILDERFRDDQDRLIRTMDELVGLALERLLKK